MARATIRIPPPPGFSLHATIRCHGWSDLPPFRTDADAAVLVIHLGRATATVRQDGAGLAVAIEGAGFDRDAVRDAVRSCLRLDLDLAGFYALCRTDPELAWAPDAGAGRFLRAPTAFADAAMILATTNCSWALTRRMVRGLVEHWGDNGAFPTKEALARATVRQLRDRAKVGYRAPFFAALARGPDLEALRTDPAPTAELRRRLLRRPGFGPYAADHFLRSIGRFEHLGLDSLVTKRWKERYPRRKPTERAIARTLARFGAWKGLAFWLLVTGEGF